jgi:hypothetical protein
MVNKTRYLLVFLTLPLLFSGAVVNDRAGASSGSVIGPYTEIQLPLEDLPALNEDLVYNPVIDQYPSGATLQVLYVLEDPRDVPLARFAYNSEDFGVIAPTNIPAEWLNFPENNEKLKELISFNPEVINVYIRVRAPEDQQVVDPVFAGQDPDYDKGDSHYASHNRYRPALDIVSSFTGQDRFFDFPCSVMEYADGTPPYQLPAEIDGGDAVGKDGLYDPAAYAPPLPWYPGDSFMLEPGEVREGWISCLAPDLPLEELGISAWYWYVPEPKIRFVGWGFEYSTVDEAYPYDPDFSDLEILGLAESDLPKSIDECAVSDHCLPLENRTMLFNDKIQDECILKATEAGLEQGLCSFLHSAGTQSETLNTLIFHTEVYEEAIADDYTAWSFTRVRAIPDSGIRLDDVPLKFINKQGEEKTDQGSVVFHNASLFTVENNKVFFSFMFVARVSVEPNFLTEQDLLGFSLYELSSYIEVFRSSESSSLSLHFKGHPEAPLTLNISQEVLADGGGFIPFLRDPGVDSGPYFHHVNYRLDTFIGEYQPSRGLESFSNMFLYDEPDSPFEGYVFAYPNEDYYDYKNALLPDVVYFKIAAIDEMIELENNIYSTRLVNIYNHSLESSTNMCEYVDCVDVPHKHGHNNEIRTVPIMCPGEWANNFIIDGLDINRDLEYVGEPYGLTSFRTHFLYQYSDFNVGDPRFWFYSGRIMGGAAPWWLQKYNGGDIIDRISGKYVDKDIRFLPFYHKAANKYYAPVDRDTSEIGWMSGIVSKKLLIFGIVEEEEYSKDNTGYLFHEEGPVWSSGCARSLLPALTDQELYVPPEVDAGDIFEGNQHRMVEMMPGMLYPVSQPRVTGNILSLGEASAPMSDYVITPMEVKVVPGKPNKPVVYVPSEDAFYPALEEVNFNNELFFSSVGAIIVPPDSSLIMIKFKAETPLTGPLSLCMVGNTNFQLIYPGYFPISSLEAGGLIRGWACRGEDYSSWLIFKFPVLDLELEKMLFSARGDILESWNFWRLTEE